MWWQGVIRDLSLAGVFALLPFSDCRFYSLAFGCVCCLVYLSAPSCSVRGVLCPAVLVDPAGYYGFFEVGPISFPRATSFPCSSR